MTGTDSPKVKAMYEDHLQSAERNTLASMKMMFMDLIKNTTHDGEEGQDILTSMEHGKTLGKDGLWEGFG